MLFEYTISFLWHLSYSALSYGSFFPTQMLLQTLQRVMIFELWRFFWI